MVVPIVSDYARGGAGPGRSGRVVPASSSPAAATPSAWQFGAELIKIGPQRFELLPDCRLIARDVRVKTFQAVEEPGPVFGRGDATFDPFAQVLEPLPDPSGVFGADHGGKDRRVAGGGRS